MHLVTSPASDSVSSVRCRHRRRHTRHLSPRPGRLHRSDRSMRTHVSRTMSARFATLRQIRSIRRSVTRPVLQSFVGR